MPTPKPILLRPGESIAQALERSVRVLAEPCSCSSDAGSQTVTERWVDYAVEPDTLCVDVTGQDDEEFRECWEQDGAIVTAELVNTAQVAGRVVAEYFLTAEAKR